MTPTSPAAAADASSRAGERPVLVLVHGYLGGAEQWAREVATFSPHFDVVTPHLPGFAAAAAEEAPDTIEGFAAHVMHTLDCDRIGQFTLLGHSMGGMIAQQIAWRIPERVERLILYGTGPLGRMPDRFEPIEVSIDRLEADGVSATARRISATWLVDGDRHPAYALLSRLGGAASAAAARAALKAMARWDGRAALPELSMPALIVWGDRDRSYRWPQVETLWRGLPNGSLAVVPNASHAVHLEKPRIFHDILLDYLVDRCDPQTA
ncbi:MAG: alpha/beta hydrolase [Azospirillaceae bacterium]